MKALKWIVSLTCVLGLVIPPGTVAAQSQCGGFCATNGSCPATGRGCIPNVCCYCCYSCDLPYTLDYNNVCAYDSQQQPIYAWMYTQVNWYNCYSGQNCTFNNTESEPYGNTPACDKCPNMV